MSYAWQEHTAQQERLSLLQPKIYTTTRMATLASLPVEIFQHIVDELPHTWDKNVRQRHNLKQCRLTCREIEAKTRIPFGKYFFSRYIIRVAPGAFDVAHQVMADDTFRTQVE